VTSVDRTAYPVFPKLVLARDLHVFFTPSPDEAVWAREKTETDEHLLALALALKCFQWRHCQARTVAGQITASFLSRRHLDPGRADSFQRAGSRQVREPS
jgi:hypothetical protein